MDKKTFKNQEELSDKLEECKESEINKIRAKKFRERRKEYIHTLEDKISKLEIEIESLKGENKSLKAQNNSEIKSEKIIISQTEGGSTFDHPLHEYEDFIFDKLAK
mmetsp:Transcript_8025/g.7102  ORF Transcript_8025/g.7102 Transcript_8025/m.7102 type:complete len:106 (+) Transcript_8025:2-319(+)